MQAIAILGCGGHASVVRDACESAGFQVIGFFVEQGIAASAPPPDERPIEINRSQGIDAFGASVSCFALGIGDNEARAWWAERLLRDGCSLPPIIHARAWVSPAAHLASGVFVGAGAVIQAGAQVQVAALINTNATVEHHCQIGMGAHIGPGAVVSGLAHVGARAMVGAGATLKDRVTIGNRAVVGAGAAVIRDVADGHVVAGVPARPIR